MFRGINALNLDNKGRIAIPTRYRERLQQDSQSQLVCTIDTEASCLLLYPLGEWEKIEEKLQALPSFNLAARRIQRLLIGHATEVEMDGNGRILIPILLRDYARLDDNNRVILLGQGQKFEVWNEQLWESGREQWLAESGKGNLELPEELQNIAL